MISKATKFIVRNNIGSILEKFDQESEAETFMKNHVMASYIQKITITSEVIKKKLKKKDTELSFDADELI